MNRDDYDERAQSTFEILRLDREALQATRQERREDLIDKVQDAIEKLRSEKLHANDVRKLIEKWCLQPFQSDVADYYLNGPGRFDDPFKTLFELLTDG